MATEAELIRVFTQTVGVPPAPQGPGDDCALLPAQRGRLCVTTDTVTEGVHFRRRTFSLEDIGHKALAVNLSDLAAMGAVPVWWTCALSLPRATSLQDVRALARGMRPLARHSGARLVGGNVSRAPALSLTLTLAGVAPRRPLLRSGARPGDLLFVGGPLGDAALGLRRLETGAWRAGDRAVRAQRRPQPQLALGALLSVHATACLDLSDGLAKDAGHLATASQVAVSLRAAQVPLSRASRQAPGALERALWGGEDYVLLAAVPPRRVNTLRRQAQRRRLPLFCIGACEPGAGVWLDGRPLEPEGPRRGWAHFDA